MQIFDAEVATRKHRSLFPSCLLAVTASVIDFTLSVLQSATFRTLPRQGHHGGHLGLKLHPDFTESARAQKNMAVNQVILPEVSDHVPGTGMVFHALNQG